MTFSEEQVEWIVVEVIRRLGLLEGQSGEHSRVAVGERSSTTAELTIGDKVVSLRTLEGRLAGVSRLIVSQRAIVTPAVKDELRARHVELIRKA